jgi:hypothetical protein
MSMSDKIADIIAEHWCSLTGNIDQHDMADAILEALPDMIAPLVWEELDEHEYGNTFTAIGKNGRHYEAGVDASGQAYWGFHASVVNDGSLVSGWIADSKAAANTHHRAAIMEAFTGEKK